MNRLWESPFVVILMGVGALSMMVPAAHALAIDDHATSRAFFYSSILFLILFLMMMLATTGMRIRRQDRSHLISILSCMVALPLMLAVPFSEAVPDTRFLNAYVEMVSSLTTTGLSLFDPERLPPSVHLWRALVGWMGGFFIWLTAVAVMAPLNLGGFEVSAYFEDAQGARQIDRVADSSMRLRRFAARLFPIYTGLTLALWLALYILGDTPLVSLCHAMSTLSTSGISPVGGLDGAGSSRMGEVVILIFLFFALSRLTYMQDDRMRGLQSLRKDPEVRMGLSILVAVSVLMFLRHWVANLEAGDEDSFLDGIRALWGSVFTVASFLTTTGFVSLEWEAARDWSGFGAPGVLLLGLAVFGGGIATTAGGVKLLRVYALYSHGLREMEKLVHPSSLGRSGSLGRKFRRQGAYAAWVFFMLFALSIAAVMTGFSLIGGLAFEEAMVLTVASLSTTGPLTEVASADPLELQQLSDGARALLSVAMIVGRLETLAVIALMNPEFWR